MLTPTVARRLPVPTPGPFLQVLIALVGGMGFFLVLFLGMVLGYNMYHLGRVYPGISVAGIDLSGLSPDQAAALLAQRLTYPEEGRITFKLGQQAWVARPAELGLYLDAQTSAEAAYSTGRHGNLFARLSTQLQAWRQGIDLSPLFVYDQRAAWAYLERIAAQVDQPAVEASLRIQGAEVEVLPGQVGRQVDIQATLILLEKQLRSLSDGELPILLRETHPAILDASAQAQAARTILSAPLTLVVPDKGEADPGPWTFEPQALAGMLSIERVESPEGARYQVGLNPDQLRSFLQGIAPELERAPANARFIFNDDTRQLELIQSAVIGRKLNLEATIQAINQRLLEGEHTIPLVFDYTNPAVGNDATAEQLGIREVVSVQASYFYGSSTSRIQNIKTAAARFHGLLVPPGATFSMAEALGDVSLDNGYAEALIIYGNRTIKGVGGGVCQVSTTLFRTAFFGGYPIVERHPHAYRVSYYELTRSGQVNPNLAGLDATVFVPVVDFKFTNDTPYWLLMETYVNVQARSLTWKFYSTSDGRTVEWDTTGLQNVVEPPEPLYQENPDLARGEIRQVDWEAAGADVTVYRTVYRNGEVYLRDEFVTHYMPWRAVYEYGPGTKIPKDKKKGED